MSKHVVRMRLLPVIMVMAVVTSMSAGIAHAGSYRGPVRPSASAVAGRRSAPGFPKLAPCTKPLLGPIRDCESTSPKVDRWWQSTKAASSCTIKFTVDWGDGSKNSKTFVDEKPGLHLLAPHTYNASVQRTYTETVTSQTLSGSCSNPPVVTTIFKITHLLHVMPPWWTGWGITKACLKDLVPSPVDVALTLAKLGVALGVFKISPTAGAVLLLFETASNAYSVFKLSRDCVQGGFPRIPRAFAYGAHHLGKQFKPSGKVPKRPRIKAIGGYQKGVLDYFRISYANPGRDAKGFGFVGIKGAGWALENHSFSHPSYGIVGHDRINYPFNLACGTAQQYRSYVEAWISGRRGIRSYPVEVALSCTT